MYNKRYKKSNKKIYGMCTIIVMLIYTISICYSTLQQQLEINGLVKVRRQENIRVTGVVVDSSTNATSNWEEYDVKNVSAGISLPESGSSITYKVKVTNFGNVDMGIYNIDGLDDRLTYTIDGYTLKDKIEKSGNKQEFKITIKYKEGSYDANNTNYNILLNFEFRAYYKVTYTGFPDETSSLPQEVMERDKLTVDLKNYQNGRYKITEKNIELLSGRYTYENNILTITSVEGDIEITYKKIPDIELVLRENDENNTLSEDIQAGMYRYQGSYEQVTNNYICFGTSSKEECLANEDKYMYRIIGITEDGQLELIKMTALNDEGVQWNNLTRSEWNTDTEVNAKTKDADVPWSESDLYKRLNGLSDKNDNLFIGNNTYDYLNENSPWYNKIADTEWLSGALRWIPEKFQLPTIYNIETGQKEAPYDEEKSPYYYNGGIEAVSEDSKYTERRNKDSVTCAKHNGLNGQVKYVTCYKTLSEENFNDRVNAKIGLMHVYEFDYAVQKDGFDCFYGNVYDGTSGTDVPKPELQTCKNSWMHISNNDNTVNINALRDWTISRIGFAKLSDCYHVLDVLSDGSVSSSWVWGNVSARPVFYLTTDITLKSGTTGTKDNPYIIANNMDGYVQDLSGNNNYGISYAAEWNDEGITTSNEQQMGYVDCGLAGYDFKQTMTVIMRVKWNGYTNNEFQCFGGNISGPRDARIGFVFSMSRDTNNPYITIRDSSHNVSTLRFGTVEFGKWNTLVAVYDKGNLTIYLNGQKNSAKIAELSTSKLPFYLGAYPIEDLSPSLPYDYSLTTFSDLLIYDRALSENEVNDNYINTINKDKVNKKALLLYYKFSS